MLKDTKVEFRRQALRYTVRTSVSPDPSRLARVDNRTREPPCAQSYRGSSYSSLGTEEARRMHDLSRAPKSDYCYSTLHIPGAQSLNCLIAGRQAIPQSVGSEIHRVSSILQESKLIRSPTSAPSLDVGLACRSYLSLSQAIGLLFPSYGSTKLKYYEPSSHLGGLGCDLCCCRQL